MNTSIHFFSTSILSFPLVLCLVVSPTVLTFTKSHNLSLHFLSLPCTRPFLITPLQTVSYRPFVLACPCNSRRSYSERFFIYQSWPSLSSPRTSSILIYFSCSYHPFTDVSYPSIPLVIFSLLFVFCSISFLLSCFSPYFHSIGRVFPP